MFLLFVPPTHQFEIVPHLFQQAVVVPLVVRGDGHAVGNLADDVQFLYADLIDLVQEVDAGDVRAVALYHVDEVVRRCIVFKGDVCAADAVLRQDRLDQVQVELGLGDQALKVDASLVLSFEDNVGRGLVQADAEALQLFLDDALVL